MCVFRNKVIPVFVALVIIAVSVNPGWGQGRPSVPYPTSTSPSESGGLMGAGGEYAMDAGYVSGPAPNALEAAIDPDTYILGPGDELGISMRGTIDSYYRVRINPEGVVLIPLASPVNVAGMTLTEASVFLRNRWNSQFQGTEISVTLVDIRLFRVSVTGAVVNPGTYGASPADRASALIPMAGGIFSEEYWRQYYSVELQQQMLTYERMKLLYDIRETSLRRAELIHRDGSVERVDLLRFERTGEVEYNPMLQSGDRLVVAYRSELYPPVQVSGAVAIPDQFEWIDGDNVWDVIQMAGGALEFSCLDSVRLTRFGANGIENVVELDLTRDGPVSDRMTEVMPGDIIFIRPQANRPRQVTVIVEGEVIYPGTFAISEGTTRIEDVIELAGGFTDNAYLRGARIWRKKEESDFRMVEYRRAQEIPSLDRATIEAQYYQFGYRWQGYDRVGVDFELLYGGNGSDEFNFFLEDGDVISVPSRQLSVLVMGQVRRPGRYPYREGWNYRDYVETAGGYAQNSRPSFIRWVEYQSSVWQKPSRRSVIGPGDMIFVPEAPERYTWSLFKELLMVASQAATVILVIQNVMRN